MFIAQTCLTIPGCLEKKALSYQKIHNKSSQIIMSNLKESKER